MAEFHYVANGQAQGPIPDSQLDQMVTSGGLSAETLIWSEGMAEWQPYATVRGAATKPGGVALAAPPVSVPGGVVCSVCQQSFPQDQVIRYGTTYVCGGCKPVFMQRLREGAQTGDGLEYASVGKRFSAKFIDSILIYIVTFGLNIAMGAANPNNAQSVSFGFLVLAVNLAVSFAYPIFFLGKWGQTLGKMAMKIRVVNPEGTSISYGKATGRVLAEMVTGFTFGIGYLMALWDAEKRALHDRLAGTRVVNASRE